MKAIVTIILVAETRKENDSLGEVGESCENSIHEHLTFDEGPDNEAGTMARMWGLDRFDVTVKGIEIPVRGTEDGDEDDPAAAAAFQPAPGNCQRCGDHDPEIGPDGFCPVCEEEGI